jgi:hypothetical protein
VTTEHVPPRPARSAGVASGSLGVGAVFALALIVIALLWAANGLNTRACVEKAEAQYPAVPVSAFTGRDTGPLKVSFTRERAEAVEGCGLF